MDKAYEINSNSDTLTFPRNTFFCLRTQPVTTCSKLTIEILEQGVKHVWCLCFSVSIINFELVNAGWIVQW